MERTDIRGDARELSSYVLYDDMLTDAREKAESAKRMLELAQRLQQATDDEPPAVSGKEVTTLYEAALAISGIHHAGTDELAAAIREIAKGFETGVYVRTPVTVGIYIEGGIVQGVQASAHVEYFTADADAFEDACAGDIANGTCDDEEHEIDRGLHAQEREAYQRYEALPYDAT